MKNTDLKLRFIGTMFFLSILTLGLTAQPRQRQGYMKERPGSGMEGLKLTDDQKSQIREIRLESMKASQPMLDEIKINRAKIEAALKKDDPDMKEIVKFVESNAKLMTEIQVKKIESQIKTRALLTEEQKVLYDAHQGRKKGRMEMARQRNERFRHPVK